MQLHLHSMGDEQRKGHREWSLAKRSTLKNKLKTEMSYNWANRLGQSQQFYENRTAHIQNTVNYQGCFETGQKTSLLLSLNEVTLKLHIIQSYLFSITTSVRDLLCSPSLSLDTDCSTARIPLCESVSTCSRFSCECSATIPNVN